MAWQLRARRLAGRSTARPGDAFFAWLALYAIARFGVETLRADDGRGAYVVGALALSTAQWTSLAVLALLGTLRILRAAPIARFAPAAINVGRGIIEACDPVGERRQSSGDHPIRR